MPSLNMSSTILFLAFQLTIHKSRWKQFKPDYQCKRKHTQRHIKQAIRMSIPEGCHR